MVDVAEGTGPVGRMHNLVLTMTGRVDDDAVNSARGMLGAGHLDAAAELLAGCLLAGRIPVTPSEQHHLRWVLEQARSQPALADRLYVAEMPSAERHRFAEPDMPEDDIAEALRPAARRLTSVRALWCVSRKTPAGVAYGAVPRRVLLAEVDSEEAVTAAGHQILTALDRAGISCSVDVFETGTDLPDYHRNALAAARQVRPDPIAGDGPDRARASRRRSGGESAGDAEGEPGGDAVDDLTTEPPLQVPPAGPEPLMADVVSESSRQSLTPIPELPVVDVAPADSARPPQPAEEFAEEPTVLRSDSVGEAAANGALAEESVLEAYAEHRSSGSNNPRVPAAVDAKLTDRERNLLRKLHEELAQREQDKEGPAGGAGGRIADGQATDGQMVDGQVDDGQQGPLSADRQDPRLATMPGTGGFPPIGAAPTSMPGRQSPPSAPH